MAVSTGSYTVPTAALHLDIVSARVSDLYTLRRCGDSFWAIVKNSQHL